MCVCVCVCVWERECVWGGMCMLSVHLWSSTDQLLFSWWLWCVTYTSCYYRQHNRHITPIHTNTHIWSNPLHHSFSRQLCTHTCTRSHEFLHTPSAERTVGTEMQDNREQQSSQPRATPIRSTLIITQSPHNTITAIYNCYTTQLNCTHLHLCI